jgi:anti-sigma B factor antagonist
VAQRRQGRDLLLRPTGRLDADTCADLRRQLAAAFAAGVVSVAVDLGAVTAVDVSGLGVLAGAARHLRKRGGGFVVLHASATIVTTMRINGMSDLLDLPPSPPLRVVEGTGSGGAQSRPRVLSVVPDESLKLPG